MGYKRTKETLAGYQQAVSDMREFLDTALVAIQAHSYASSVPVVKALEYLVFLEESELQLTNKEAVLQKAIYQLSDQLNTEQAISTSEVTTNADKDKADR